MQAPRKNTPALSYYIVGASIARPPLPNAGSCVSPRSPYRTPPPLPHLQTLIPPPHRWRACHAGPYKQKARLTQKHSRPFYYIVGAGLGSARVCRTLALAFCPAAHTEHPRPCRTRKPENTPPPFLLYSRGEHCSPAHTAAANPQLLIPHS